MSGENEIVAFIRDSIGSVYAIEALVLIMRRADRQWVPTELVRELRSSSTAVAEALGRLMQAGLVSETSEGCYTFAPASKRLAQIADEIQKRYALAPIRVMTAVVATPDRNE